MGNPPVIRVSDHALLRFLERFVGIDIEGTRAEIERDFTRAQGAADLLGLNTYSIRAKGHIFVVRAGTVTTVLPELGPHSRYAALAPRTVAD